MHAVLACAIVGHDSRRVVTRQVTNCEGRQHEHKTADLRCARGLQHTRSYSGLTPIEPTLAQGDANKMSTPPSTYKIAQNLPASALPAAALQPPGGTSECICDCWHARVLPRVELAPDKLPIVVHFKGTSLLQAAGHHVAPQKGEQQVPHTVLLHLAEPWWGRHAQVGENEAVSSCKEDDGPILHDLGSLSRLLTSKPERVVRARDPQVGEAGICQDSLPHLFEGPGIASSRAKGYVNRATHGRRGWILSEAHLRARKKVNEHRTTLQNVTYVGAYKRL